MSLPKCRHLLPLFRLETIVPGWLICNSKLAAKGDLGQETYSRGQLFYLKKKHISSLQVLFVDWRVPMKMFDAEEKQRLPRKFAGSQVNLEKM
jgi:hypothetical protein